MRVRFFATLAVGLLAAGVSRADDGIQTPQLSAPQRGSMAGEYGKVAFGPADVSRGGFSLPGPFHAPSDRGTLAAGVFPGYSPDSGLSEYGLGWGVTLAVTRTRQLGDLDYATDDLSGPLGRLVKGTDGYYYPAGLTSQVRVGLNGSTLTAWQPDGSVWTFGSATRVDTARGTFAWYLDGIVTPTGQHTAFTWTTNTSGRPFLQSVTWGGTGTDYQYRIDFDYETLASIFVSYQSGSELTLDRRVKTITVRAKNNGSFDERWHYGLVYISDGLGPAFHLAEVDQVFASGEAAPPVRYGYKLAADTLGNTTFQPNPQLDPVLAQFGSDVFNPPGATPLDADNDGRLDLEEHNAFSLISHGDTGFTVTPLPPAASDANAWCRPPAARGNRPRLLAQLRSGDDETQVVALAPNAGRAGTTLFVCDRDGTQRYQQQLAGNWQLAANVKLVDLDRDHQPDLVQVGVGTYSVLVNQSGPAGFAFDPTPRTGTLQPAVVPNATYLQDINGDGLPDLIVRTISDLVVWYGIGNYQFTPEGQAFEVRSREGNPIAGFDTYDVSFIDANHDGLSDLLLTRGPLFFVHINDGLDFTDSGLISFDTGGRRAGIVSVADLSGGGNAELTMAKDGHGWSLDLDEAGTGLLASADDGKGNVLHFAWTRSPAANDARRRQPVLASLTVDSTGIDEVTYHYVYAAPETHSRAGYLLGFDEVTRTDALHTLDSHFFNRDDVQGLPVSDTSADSLAPQVVKFSTQDWDPQTFAGIPWLRKKSSTAGFRSPDGSQTASTRTDYVDWQNDFCPHTVTVTSPSGTRTTTSTRASLPGWDQALHCLMETTVDQGKHPVTSFDFTQQHHVVRNAMGLVERVETPGSAGTLVAQTAGYNSDGTVAWTSSPDKGTTTYAYDPATHLVASLGLPDGENVSATRDPRTDALLTLRTVRGTVSETESYRFDGQERLMKSWNDQGGANEQSPLTSFGYRYATAAQPGLVNAATRVDAGAIQQSLELFTATGTSLATARALPGGWGFDPLSVSSPVTAQSQKLLRPATTADPSTFDVPTLLAGTHTISSSHATSFGFAADSVVSFQSDAARQLNTTAQVSAGLVSVTTTENGTLATHRDLDPTGAPVTFTDEAGTHWVYHRDVLGRVRAVDLPGGIGHRASYDEYGHLVRVDRDGVASIAWSFDIATGRVTSQHFLAPDGTAVRAIGFTYDSIGRKIAESHVDLETGATTGFNFYYDGATPASPTVRTTLGALSAVSGDGFVKRFDVRGDGKPIRRTVELTGWRTVVSEFTYDDTAMVKRTDTRVYDPTGALLTQSSEAHAFDGLGRLATVSFGDGTVGTLAYDADGLPASVTFADGSQVTLTRDAYTRRTVGVTQHAAAFLAGNQTHLNARGLTDNETITVGVTSVTRQYGYSAERYLLSSSDASHGYGYGFDGAGLPVELTTDVTTATVTGAAGSNGALDSGGVHYQLDHLGRTIQRGDLQLQYGGDGQLARATRGAQSWVYTSDESGRRLIKRSAGVPVGAWVDEGYLDGNTLLQPVTLLGVRAGVLRGGHFQQTPSDLRGTVQGDLDGTAKMASPFGARDQHPDVSTLADFALAGWDPDLGFARMGLRDYDPSLARFLTPDPLFLAEPGRCVDSPVECNLYSYAKNDPIAHVDPSGLEGEESEGGKGEEKEEEPEGFAAASWKFGEQGRDELKVGAIEHDWGVSKGEFETGITLSAVKLDLNALKYGDKYANVSLDGSVSVLEASAHLKLSMEEGVQVGGELVAAKVEGTLTTCHQWCLSITGEAGLLAKAEFKAGKEGFKAGAGLGPGSVSVSIKPNPAWAEAHPAPAPPAKRYDDSSSDDYTPLYGRGPQQMPFQVDLEALQPDLNGNLLAPYAPALNDYVSPTR
jgi:RHS repeat-associated protein